MKRLTLILIIALLGGCSGGLAGRTIPADAPVQSDPTSAGAIAGALVVKLPLELKAERAHYLSTSTKSVELAVSPASGCHGCTPEFTKYLSLTPNSKGCTNTAKSGIVCTIGVDVKPGTYDANVATFDGAPKCTSCRELSFAQHIKLVAAGGKIQVPTLTLDGVPHYLGYTLLDGSAIVERGNDILRIVGGSTKARMLVYAYDADGNVIFGSGTPKFSATATGGFSATTSGNVVQVASPSQMSASNGQLKLEASGPGCSVTGTTCTLDATLQFDPLIAVADETANAVTIYPTHYYGPLPFARITAHVSSPLGVVFDRSGNLYVANGDGSVGEYAQPYGGATVARWTGISGNPALLATSPNGHLAVGNAGTDSVAVYLPPSATKVASVGLAAAPATVAFDASNNLWIGTTGQLIRIPPPYTGAANLTMNASNDISNPVGIAFDGGGELYVADTGKAAVMDYTKPYTGTPAAMVSVAGLDGVYADGDAIAVCAGSQISIYDSGSLAAAVSLPISDSTPQVCAMDGNGDWYDTDATFGSIGEFDALAYAYFGAVADGLEKPTAMAAFP